MFLAAITLSAKAVYCESYVKKKKNIQLSIYCTE